MDRGGRVSVESRGGRWTAKREEEDQKSYRRKPPTIAADCRDLDTFHGFCWINLNHPIGILLVKAYVYAESKVGIICVHNSSVRNPLEQPLLANPPLTAIAISCPIEQGCTRRKMHPLLVCIDALALVTAEIGLLKQIILVLVRDIATLYLVIDQVARIADSYVVIDSNFQL
jgi:hypothetical protein